MAGLLVLVFKTNEANRDLYLKADVLLDDDTWYNVLENVAYMPGAGAQVDVLSVPHTLAVPNKLRFTVTDNKNKLDSAEYVKFTSSNSSFVIDEADTFRSIATFYDGFESTYRLTVYANTEWKGYPVTIHSYTELYENYPEAPSGVVHQNIYSVLENFIKPSNLIVYTFNVEEDNSGFIIYRPTVVQNSEDPQSYIFSYIGNDYITSINNDFIKWIGLIDTEHSLPVLEGRLLTLVTNGSARSYYNVGNNKDPKGALKMWNGDEWARVN